MLPTNLDLSQLHREHERILGKWDAQVCKRELGKTHPRFVRLAPTVALPWFRLRRWVRRMWGSPLAYAIRSEIRGIVPRIRFQLASTTYRDMYQVQSYQVDANGRYRLDTRTQTRIHDMQALSTNHSWFGAADEWVYLQAWEAGARWAESNSHTSKTE